MPRAGALLGERVYPTNGEPLEQVVVVGQLLLARPAPTFWTSVATAACRQPERRPAFFRWLAEHLSAANHYRGSVDLESQCARISSPKPSAVARLSSRSHRSTPFRPQMPGPPHPAPRDTPTPPQLDRCRRQPVR